MKKIMPSTPPQDQPSLPPRKRGGQKGNRNARKHGFYSHINSEAAAPLPPLGQGRLQGDINLFKVIIARLTSGLQADSRLSDSFTENLATLQVVSVAVARLNSLCATNKRLFASGDSELIEFCQQCGLTDEEVQDELARSSGFSRGAQPGNRNALKHGYYASVFDPAEVRQLDRVQESDLDEEIDLMRLLIKRTVASMPPRSGLSHSEVLKTVRVLTYAVYCVEKLELTRSLIFNHGNIVDDAIDSAMAFYAKRWEKV
jgi:hypothetical protein